MKFRSTALLASALLLTLPLFSAAHAATLTAALYQNTEYNFSYALNAIHAADAFARGFVGGKNIVADFDSGITASNSEFAGQLAGPGWDAILGKQGVTTDNNGHGTFTAGIIGAAMNGTGMEGVAPHSLILPIRIVNADGSITLSDAKMAAGIRYATAHGARIFNNSWNSSATIAQVTKAQLNYWMPQELQAYREAVSAGALIVFAAGNEHNTQVGFYAALPTLYSELTNGWIASVATDQTGAIASYSNRCGAAAAWCIAAPGSNVVSTLGTGYGTGSGTSFSTPMISGAIAVLKQAWPKLTAAQIRSILFTTANKTGIYANSSIYGQGFLDLDKATRPVGVTSVPVKTTTTPAPVTHSTATFGRSMGARGFGDLHMIVLDSYGRDFQADSSTVFQQATPSFDSVTALSDFGKGVDVIKVGSASYGFALAPDNRITLPNAPLDGARMFIDSGDADLAVTAAVNMSPAMVFGLTPDLNSGGRLVDNEAVENAYFTLAKNPSSFAVRHNFNDSLWVKSGAFFGEQLSDPSAPPTLTDDPNYLASRGSVMGGVTEIGRSIGHKSAVALQAGLLIEDGAMLGSASSGAAALAQRSTTHFIGAEAKFDLGAGYNAFAGIEIGQTDVDAAHNSMVVGVKNLTSDSWRLGFTKTGVVGAKDRFGFIVSQPLHSDSGSANLNMPTSLNPDGTVAYTAARAGLAAEAREVDIQAFYATEVSQNSSITTGIMLRQNPGNATGDADAVLLSRYKLSF